jgi:hypothetical protein
MVALAAAALPWVLVRIGVPPHLHLRVYWPLVALVGCALAFSFCMGWGREVMEYRDHHGRPSTPPVGDRP